MSSDNHTSGVVILGSPRSGTTLLRRLLDAHPNIACPSETNVFTACGRFLRSERIAGGTRIGVVEGLGFAGFSEEDVIERLREMAFSFHRDYAQSQKKTRWASKTAFDSFYLPEIEKLCTGHVTFVVIQRHGFDVACSLQELSERNGGYLREMHDYVVRHPIVLEACAHAWSDLSVALHQFTQRHARDSLTVRYEDLAADPDTAMTKIMRHIGEEWDAGLTLQALKKRSELGLGDWKTYGARKVHTKSVGRWHQLPSDSKRRLADICNPTLTTIGYDPVDIEVDTNRGDEHSRRRYELGLLMQGMGKETKDSKAAGKRSKSK